MSTTAPSHLTALPASKLSYPLGSLEVVICPFVITVVLKTYGLLELILALGAKANAYPLSLTLS